LRFLYHSLKELPVTFLKVPKGRAFISAVFQVFLKELKARSVVFNNLAPGFYANGDVDYSVFGLVQNSKASRAGSVTGKLTLHGVTKPVMLNVVVNKVGQNPLDKIDPAAFPPEVLSSAPISE
jgi:hypothetical protein